VLITRRADVSLFFTKKKKKRGECDREDRDRETSKREAKSLKSVNESISSQ